MAAAIWRMVHYEEGARTALKFVNGHSDSLSPHLLSRTAVQRVWQTLPPPLRHPDTCTQPAVLDFIQQQQEASRAAQQNGLTLLTKLEEDVLVDFVQFRHSSNASIGAEVIKGAAHRVNG
jgi:hypothetical protein